MLAERRLLWSANNYKNSKIEGFYKNSKIEVFKEWLFRQAGIFLNRRQLPTVTSRVTIPGKCLPAALPNNLSRTGSPYTVSYRRFGRTMLA